ncbi:Set1 complex component spp1 [Talaromyces islandicus]|uniref:Set1 complex component spp1 n=1 Tax=Talaromyces islandicus TaxID=28573 RepID=A0A0U1LR34_TALIS|nr:Set1 complex component spp1 [Talaromyces islandicus]
MGVNPYEADPTRVPKKDPYLARSPHYGRYLPRADDFTPRSTRWYSAQSDDGSVAYWKEIVDRHCTSQNSLNAVGSQEVFAVGKVLVRVDRSGSADPAAEIYAAALNANELAASRKAQDALKDLQVAVPTILFCGTIDGNNVVVETRIPGVSLEVAWNYLSEFQKQDFKRQCQHILRRLATIDEQPPLSPSYISRDLNTVPQPDIPDVERDILFAPREGGEELIFVHNDMTRSNIILDDDRVVGILGWRQSGFFGHDRAQRVHRLLRIPERSHIFASGERSTHDQAWADLYDALLMDGSGAPRNHDLQYGEPVVKTESPAASIERAPMSPTLPSGHLAQLDGADEHPTPKKITDLKRGSISRASSIDRSSPSAPLNPSKLGPNARKSSSVSTTATKKASTAKKVQPKKRKLDALELDSVNGERRSHSPASSKASKGSGVKKPESLSAAGSPAPESKKGGRKRGKKTTKPAAAGDSRVQDEGDCEDSDVENPDEIFCICRRPDNHTWMIGCDGGCEDWFHGKCVNVNQEDEELIERYICPNCTAAGKGKTTWKPMCRLKGCRKPARLSKKKISKYCSDDHGREFMRRLTQRLIIKPNPVAFDRIRGQNNRDSRSVDGDGDSPMETNDEDDEQYQQRIMPEDLGSRGGVLTIGDLKAVVMRVSSAEEFRRLGERLITPPPAPPVTISKKEEKETDNPQKKQAPAAEEYHSSNKMGLDIHPPGVVYSIAEEAKLQKLRKRRAEYRRRGEMIAQRDRFLGLVRARAKTVLDRLKAKEPKGGWKDICGFDARMAWNEEELDEWLQTEAGRKAFEEDKLEAEELPTNGTDTKMQDPADTDDDDEDEDENKSKNVDAEFAELSRGVCIKKRCDRHKQWVRLVQQDTQFEQAMLKCDFEACEKEANAIVEGAVLRICSQQ